MAEKKNEEVSLLFTGGWDSTLAAFKLCETFKKVHLLTYYYSNSAFVERSEVNVSKLKDRFGSDKVIHRIIDFDSLRWALYHGTWWKDIKKYGLFLINCECTACRIAMFARTIIYNLENDIPYCVSGETQVVPFNPVPSLINKFLEFKNKLCSDYGIANISLCIMKKIHITDCLNLGLSIKKSNIENSPTSICFMKRSLHVIKVPWVLFSVSYIIYLIMGKRHLRRCQ